MTDVGHRLFVFDMDGTLLPKSTGLLELARALDTTAQLEELEAKFSAGMLDTLSFTKEISTLWGAIDKATAREAFQAATKIDGISDVVEQIRQIGGVSCVVTMSQDIFANSFLELGFDHVFATPYPPHNGNDFSKVLKPEDKVSLVKNLSQRHRFTFDQTVAFGDSISDVELFSRIRHSIAVNGDRHVIEKASFSYQGNSILEAFQASKTLWSQL